MLPFEPGTDLVDLLHTWQGEADGNPYTAIILRRIFCDNLHPMPKDAEWWERTQVYAERAQCMREREDYSPPRDAPPSRRFAEYSAFAAGQRDARFFECARCRRLSGARVTTVRRHVPGVGVCECGADGTSGRQHNAALEARDVESRAYWSSVRAEHEGQSGPVKGDAYGLRSTQRRSPLSTDDVHGHGRKRAPRSPAQG